MAVTKMKTELNIVNLFLCILVIFIHAASPLITQLYKGLPSFGVVYCLWKAATVAVPGFLFVSGVKCALSEPSKGYISFIWHKILKIYLPYAVCCVLYYLYFYSLSYYPFSVSDLIRHIGIGDLTAHFYFVIIIMQFYILSPILKWLLKRYNTTLILLCALLFTILLGEYLPNMVTAFSGGRWQIRWNDRLFTTYLFYFMLGLAAGRHYSAFLAMLAKNKVPLLIVGALCLYLNLYFGFKGTYTGNAFGFAGLLQTMYCVAFIPCLLYFAQKLAKLKTVFASGLFNLLNQATYFVYLLHLLIMYFINTVLEAMGVTGALDAFFLRFFGTMMISFLLCGGYVACKQRLRR